jgi:histone H3/H4
VAEAKVGDEFITHEFDEAIAIQRAIVEAGQRLGKVHPHRPSRTAIAAATREDETFLRTLERLGEAKGATGKIEDVAEGIDGLLSSSVEKAGDAPSEAYEAHAVLLNAKRKQQDSADGMLRIARARKDTEVRDAATEFGRAQKAACKALGDALANFAVVIAQADRPTAIRRNSRSSSATSRS